MLDAPGGPLGDVHLLAGAGHAQVLGPGQVRTAPARPGRVMIDDLVRHRPRHGRPGRAGLLAPLARRPPGRASLLAGQAPARQVIRRGRQRRVFAVARQQPLPPRDPLAQLGDLSVPRRAPSTVRSRWRQIGHNRRSSEPAHSSQSDTLGRPRQDHHAPRPSRSVSKPAGPTDQVNVYAQRPRSGWAGHAVTPVSCPVPTTAMSQSARSDARCAHNELKRAAVPHMVRQCRRDAAAWRPRTRSTSTLGQRRLASASRWHSLVRSEADPWTRLIYSITVSDRGCSGERSPSRR